MLIFNSIHSSVKSLVSALCSIVWVPRCPVCGERLTHGERDICTMCRISIPTTGFSGDRENPLEQRFWGLVPIEMATSLFWFVDGSDWRKVIHAFKYGGRRSLARMLGRWLGRDMAESGRADDIDLIIPVPLHWRKRLGRGYNQSEYIAKGVADVLGCKCDFRAVKRIRNNPSQTAKTHNERWNNVAGIFRVQRAKNLVGRHILLVDDVYTSGATIVSLAEAIIAACDGNVRLSVATLAVSRKSLGTE